MDEPSEKITGKTHFGYATVDARDKARKVRAVFDSVADRYDLMNDLMSGGLHRWWKRVAVEETAVRPGQVVLDLAGGSGDLALAFARRVRKEGYVVLADINAAMLEKGRSRLVDAGIVTTEIGMAARGLKPVVEMRVVDFALCAMDEIVNQAAKNRFMFGGQGRVPAVIRMPIGIWTASAAQHSQSLESWFAHIPGLVVMTPATPQDNYTLLRAAIAMTVPTPSGASPEMVPQSLFSDTLTADWRRRPDVKQSVVATDVTTLRMKRISESEGEAAIEVSLTFAGNRADDDPERRANAMFVVTLPAIARSR